MPRNNKIFPTLPKDVVKIQNNTYSHGSNQWAQSSANAIVSADKTQRSVVPSDTINAHYVAASCGWSHALLLNSVGWAYACGSNLFSKCQGDGLVVEDLIKPLTWISANVKQVVAASLGENGNSFIVTTTDTAFGWGSNEFSSAWGNGDTTVQIGKRQIATGVGKLSASDTHTIILKLDGTVWAFGANIGSKSRGDGDEFPATTIAQIDTDCIDIAAGHNHTILLKSNGDAWGFGVNNFGQARGDGNTDDYQLDKFLIATNVRQVVCGGVNTYIVKNDNTLYGCGANEYGQSTANGTNDVVNGQPAFYQMSADCVEVTAGHNTCFRKDAAGRYWGVGENAHGQLVGDGDTANKLNWTLLQDNRNLRWMMNDSPGGTHTMFGVAEKISDVVG